MSFKEEKMTPEKLTALADEHVNSKRYKQHIKDPHFKLFLKNLIFMLQCTTANADTAFRRGIDLKNMKPTTFGHVLGAASIDGKTIITNEIEVIIRPSVTQPKVLNLKR